MAESDHQRRKAGTSALSSLELASGLFRGVVAPDPGIAVPAAVELVVAGSVVSDAELRRQEDGSLAFTAPVPAEVLADGVHTVVFRLRPGGAQVGRYVLRAGDVLTGDIAAELSALDAEVAALKRAFMTEAADRKLRAAERPLIVEETVTSVLRELSGSLPDLPGRGRPEDG